MSKQKWLALAGLPVVVATLVAVVAMAVQYVHSARIKNNEQAAIETMRTLVTQENLWHKQDVDGNGVNDFWAIDVAGMYRILRRPEGTEAKMIDIAIAESDWSPDGAGDGGGGEFPIVAVPFVPGKQIPGLATMGHVKPVPNSGYYVAAYRFDAAETPYATDVDGAGPVYENDRRFAFMAFPEKYDGTGMNAFVVDASGMICRTDATSRWKYDDPTGPVVTVFPACPQTRWPWYGEGWSSVELVQ